MEKQDCKSPYPKLPLRLKAGKEIDALGAKPTERKGGQWQSNSEDSYIKMYQYSIVFIKHISTK